MNAPKRQLAGAALVGRRIGIAAFWCLAVFVLVASTRSVLLELYGKPQGVGDSVRCSAELRSLHSSLLEQASAELRDTSETDAYAHTQRWLRQWDQRFAGTRDMCAGLWEARETLQSLRKRLEVMLRDFAKEQRPLNDRIERGLSRAIPWPRSISTPYHSPRES
jgi:hypothetical protein